MENVSLKLEILEDKEVYAQIIASEKNIRKSKIKEFKY